MRRNILPLIVISSMLITAPVYANGRSNSHSSGYSGGKSFNFSSGESYGYPNEEDEDEYMGSFETSIKNEDLSGFFDKDFDSENFDMDEDSLEDMGFDMSRFPARITVDAQGIVKAAPDKASTSFTVEETAETNDEAMEKCSKLSAKLIEALEEAYKEITITSDSVRVYPEYDDSYFGNNEIKGYRASIDVNIADAEPENIGKIIADAMENGAASVGSINYYCSRYDDLYLDALEKAVEAAEDKAIVIADSGNLDSDTLKISSISEGYQNTSSRYVSNEADMITFDSAEGVSTKDPYEVPVINDDLDIVANVSVAFEAEKLD